MSQTSNSSMNNIKFLYSYGGKIVPRPSDGRLRYVGGFTRVLAVDRSVTFSELMVKFGESCGSSMNLKCKLPTEDLDMLISVKSDEDLRSVMEEYERASPDAKIRAVIFPIKSEKKASPPSSPVSSFDFPSAPKPQGVGTPIPAECYFATPTYRCFSAAVGYPVTTGKYHHTGGRNPRCFHRMPRRNDSH